MLLPVLAAAMLTAQSTPATNTPSPSSEEQKAQDKIVCKSDIVTGSRSQRRRTCMPQSEWNRLRDNTRDAVTDYITRSTSGATPSN